MTEKQEWHNEKQTYIKSNIKIVKEQMTVNVFNVFQLLSDNCIATRFIILTIKSFNRVQF